MHKKWMDANAVEDVKDKAQSGEEVLKRMKTTRSQRLKRQLPIPKMHLYYKYLQLLRLRQLQMLKRTCVWWHRLQLSRNLPHRAPSSP